MDTLIERFRRLDVCAVSDAMDKLKLPHQVATGLTQQSGSQRIVGRAVTYRLVPADTTLDKPEHVRHLGTTAIEVAAPGDVVVVEQRTGIDAGCWGGILTLGAKLKGIAGVVADGPVRDIVEARALDFPVYCRQLTSLTARGRVVEAAVNCTVEIGAVMVHPGDYVIADAGGVAFVPCGKANEVLDIAESIAAREAAMAAALLEGASVATVMGADYEHMLR